MRETKLDQAVYNYLVIPAAVFTANATTDIFTSNAHGLTNEDKVQLTTATTLPAGLSLATSYYVITATTNTFQLSATPNGSAIDITDAGTGAHTYHLKGKAVYVGDWKYVAMSLTFSSTPTMTIKFQAAITDTFNCPDFASVQSPTNIWDYLDATDLQNDTSIDGDTGIACAGTADYRLFRLNTNGISWICADVTAWTAGVVGIRISTFQ